MPGQGVHHPAAGHPPQNDLARPPGPRRFWVWLERDHDEKLVPENVAAETVIAVERPEKLSLQPYPVAFQAAEPYLTEAIAIANANAFTLPATWINGNPLSNVQLAHGS